MMVKKMINKINNTINEYINTLPNSIIKKIVSHSLTSSGKRIRPLLCLSLLADLNFDINFGLDMALAIELIHTYSLIHDDLPAMDNDTYRRDKLCAHIKFGEANALLAGDSLLTDSFRIISNSQYYCNDTKVKLINLLSNYSGINGMVLGQELDLNYSHNFNNLDNYLKLIDLKTGALIKLSLLSALIISGSNSHELVKWENIAYKIGIAFQVQDDCLDGDKKDNYTILNYMNINDANNYAQSLYNQILDEINDYSNTKQIINSLFNRQK